MKHLPQALGALVLGAGLLLGGAAHAEVMTTRTRVMDTPRGEHERVVTRTVHRGHRPMERCRMVKHYGRHGAYWTRHCSMGRHRY